MTKALCRAIYRDWENDPALYEDMTLFQPYIYSEERADRYFDAKQEPSRILYAIMADEEPVGELQLKNIDPAAKECTLSIHLKNDSFKGKGYGTEAERLAVRYAFETLGMQAVNADTVLKNTRSQRVLEKVGFRFIKEEGQFRYYRMERQDTGSDPAEA